MKTKELKIEQSEILQQAVKRFGIDNQIEMVVEECSELIQAIQKLKRSAIIINKGSIPEYTTFKNNLIYANLCSEIAVK